MTGRLSELKIDYLGLSEGDQGEWDWRKGVRKAGVQR